MKEVGTPRDTATATARTGGPGSEYFWRKPKSLDRRSRTVAFCWPIIRYYAMQDKMDLSSNAGQDATAVAGK